MHPVAVALLLGLSGCVVHVHERGEVGSSGSSGGETANADQTGKPVTVDKPGADKPAVADKDDDKDDDKPGTKPDTDKPGTSKPGTGKPVGSDVRDEVANNDRDKPSGGSTVKPGTGTKPGTDKPAGGTTKPGTVTDKVVPMPDVGDKLADVGKPGTGTGKPGTDKPTDKPVTDKPDDKPTTGKPAVDKPQAVEPGPHDKSDHLADKPVKFTQKDRDKVAGTPRTEVAMDKDKGKPTRDPATPAGKLAGTRVAEHMAATAPCKLYSRSVEAGGKLRLKVAEGSESTEVLLAGKPLTVTKREPNAWVVAIADDAQSGHVSLKEGDKSIACGRVEVR